MKRTKLLKYVRSHDCRLVREGSNHSVWIHSPTERTTVIQRHREIPWTTVVKVCKDLGIPLPSGDK